MTQATTAQTSVERCLAQVNAAYLELLRQPGQFDQCKEAGRTVRHLARCLCEADGFDTDDLDDEEAELETDDL
jgi:hypothetical protein